MDGSIHRINEWTDMFQGHRFSHAIRSKRHMKCKHTSKQAYNSSPPNGLILWRQHH
jgi:hypothetical protein